MTEKIISTICDFLTFAGVSYQFASLTGETFLPGLEIQNGSLIIDREKLVYPGDILHEAGHLATAAPSVRQNMNGKLEKKAVDDGGEIMAIAWSYAACVHLDLDPKIVFHDGGYQTSSNNLVKTFKEGGFFGQPMLNWVGMTYMSAEQADQFNSKPFPHMIRWLRICGPEGAYASDN
jgi:hypothetical protein